MTTEMNSVLKRCVTKFIMVQKSTQLRNTPNSTIHSSTNRCVLLAYHPSNCLQFWKYRLQLSIYRLLSVSRNRCWKCNAVVTEKDLVCMGCGGVQEPRTQLNYFDIFKEMPQFDIDTRNLTVKFRRLQTLLHPDKIASRSEKEKDFSAEQSSLVNKAYQTLLRPIERGLYLLELNDKPLTEELQMAPEFLMDIMELNEALELCRKPQTLEHIRHVNEAKLQILFSEVALAFKEKNIDKARVSLSKLKYYINLDVKIKDLEEELGVSRED